MRKNSRLKVPVTVSLDFEYLEKFEEKHKGELSSYINRMLKEETELAKNEQAHEVDPLNLCRNSVGTSSSELGKVWPLSNNTRQSNLFESFATKDHRDQIVKFVQSIEDTTILNKIETNARCMLKVSETHRSKIAVRSR